MCQMLKSKYNIWIIKGKLKIRKVKIKHLLPIFWQHQHKPNILKQTTIKTISYLKKKKIKLINLKKKI